jgi:hypothetical protein
MKTKYRAIFVGLLSATALSITGCPCPPAVPRAELIERYNGNADKVTSLWAVADVEVQITDDKGKVSSYRLQDGRLLMKKRSDDPFGPQDFLLRGKAFDQEFFQLGVDGGAGEHYFWLAPPEGRGKPYGRWGRIADLGRPVYESLPVDPTQLLELLGVLAWRDRSDGFSLTICTPMEAPCVYDLMFVSGLPGGRLSARKVWLDRRDKLNRPTRVWLYDPEGECVLSADLGRYETVATDAPKAEWPVIPTDISIHLQAKEGIRAIRLRLSDATVETAKQPIPEAAFHKRIPERVLKGDDARPLGPIGAMPSTTRPVGGHE